MSLLVCPLKIYMWFATLFTTYRFLVQTINLICIYYLQPTKLSTNNSALIVLVPLISLMPLM